MEHGFRAPDQGLWLSGGYVLPGVAFTCPVLERQASIHEVDVPMYVGVDWKHEESGFRGRLFMDRGFVR